MKTVGQLWQTCACAVLLSIPPCLLHAKATETKYRGFTIDESQVGNLEQIEALRTAIKEQIDIVCVVGMPVEILTFFQGVPLVLVPTGTIPSESPGFYGGKDRNVKVGPSILTVGHKPVLLHELLHAFHDQRLKGGVKNREILAYFERAKVSDAYAAGSHMMQNEKEFFACSATTFLFGVTAQEPFRREKIKQSQPEFLAYLQGLFGPNTGSYVGSLQR